MKTDKMKLTNRTSLGMKILVMAFLCIGFLVSSVPAMAATKKAVAPGMACKSGRYIYYGYCSYNEKSYNGSNGIVRYDTKTKKKKRISSTRAYDVEKFYSMNLKGNYIYAVWNQGNLGYPSYYIYRINLKTGARKKLATGKYPVVIGQYIYYEKAVYNDEADMTLGTGKICRMTLAGKNKETVKAGIVDEDGDSDISRLYVCDGEVLYARESNDHMLVTLDGKEISRSSLKIEEDISYNNEEGATQKAVVSGGYRYYISKSGKSLCRKNLKSGKVSKLATYKGIDGFRICGKYILIEAWTGTYKNGLAKCRGFCMKLNGKAKKTLATWGES